MHCVSCTFSMNTWTMYTMNRFHMEPTVLLLEEISAPLPLPHDTDMWFPLFVLYFVVCQVWFCWVQFPWAHLPSTCRTSCHTLRHQSGEYCDQGKFHSLAKSSRAILYYKVLPQSEFLPQNEPQHKFLKQLYCTAKSSLMKEDTKMSCP